MAFSKPFKLVMKEVSESEWLQVTIRTLPLLSLNKLVFWILTGSREKEIAPLCKESNSENSLEVLSMKELMKKL